jgi:hypothetical protein
MRRRRYEYSKISETNEIRFMSAINSLGSKGYRVCKWYENPSENIYTAIMERVKYV